MPTLTDLEREWEAARARPPVASELPCGIHLNVPFEYYRDIPAINFSSLRTAKQSLAHFRYAAPMEESPAFRFGSLIHCGKLEPEEFEKRYIVLPDRDFIESIQNERKKAGEEPYTNVKATKAYKTMVQNFMLLDPDKQEVSSDWYDDMRGILTALASEPLCAEIFRTGLPEVTALAVCPHTGARLKIRIDFLVTDPISPVRFADLKTTEDPFNWSPDKFDYHIQAAFYRYVYSLALAQHPWSLIPLKDATPFPSITDQSQFVFAAIEKRRPYTILAAPISPQALEVGEQEATFLLEAVVSATKAQRYPRLCLRRDFQWDLSRWYRPMEFPLARHSTPIPTLPEPTPTPTPTPAKTPKKRAKKPSKRRAKRG